MRIDRQRLGEVARDGKRRSGNRSCDRSDVVAVDANDITDAELARDRRP